MNTLLPILVIVFAVATLGVLAVGMVAMIRGGEFNRKYGNKLMRARVGLQAAAIVLFLLFVVAASTDG